MKTIKFSSNYPKLHNQKEAILLNVKGINYHALDKDLIEYDTKNDKGEYYPLPKTNLLHLTFLGNKLIPFCTIRRSTPQKDTYYYNSVGEVFNVEITTPKEQGEKLE